MLRIKLIKSVIGGTPRNRATVRALGLTKTQMTVEHEDNPQIRGMVHHVKHLLQVEVVDGTPKVSNRPDKKRRSGAPKVTASKPKAVKAVAAPVAESAPKVEKSEAPKPKAAPKAAAKPAAKAPKPKSEDK